AFDLQRKSPAHRGCPASGPPPGKPVSPYHRCGGSRSVRSAPLSRRLRRTRPTAGGVVFRPGPPLRCLPLHWGKLAPRNRGRGNDSMYSIIVVPPSGGAGTGQIRLGAGERVGFGRAGRPDGLVISHGGVPRIAGEIAAHRTFWLLSNLSEDQTYVVENPEGAGEHVKIAPGRVDAPVPFEFSRVTLPAAGDLLTFDVWAPRHAFRSAERHLLAGSATAPAFALDRTKRYFAVLTALCERRLRG